MKELDLYEVIPEFDQIQTMKDVYADDFEKQTSALCSLTYYSSDKKLILKTLESFIANPKREIRSTVFLCLNRYLEMYEEIPIDKFLPFVVSGLEKKDEFAIDCFESLFYNLEVNWSCTTKEINSILKSGYPIDIVKVQIFINKQNWKSEKLNPMIKKCLKHQNPAVRCGGGILLRKVYEQLHFQLSDYVSSIKLASKIDKPELQRINDDVYITTEWIEEIIVKLKAKLDKKNSRS